METSEIKKNNGRKLPEGMVQRNYLLPEELVEQIEAAAKENVRSKNGEVIVRLRDSFKEG